jgi:hypothetical protein
MTPEHHVHEYFSRIRAADVGIVNLFTAHAIMRFEGGVTITGHHAIKGLYLEMFTRLAPQPTLESLIGSPPTLAAVVDVRSTQGRYRAVNIFTFDDVGIERLDVFRQVQSEA